MEDAPRLADERDGGAPEEVPAQKTDPRLFGEILPPEIWERIADKVLENSSEDHSNLVNSSRYFQNLRASQRTTALFEQVLLIVAVSVWKKEGLEGFPVKDVLNCRLVCKKWNTAVQNVVPDQFAISGKSFVGKGLDHSKKFEEIGTRFEAIQEDSWIGDEYTPERKIEDKNSIYKFLSHFRQSHGPNHQPKGRNPFFCIKIKIDVNEEIWPTDPPVPYYQRYLQAINEMLSLYGTQVDIFKVDSDQLPFLMEALPLLPKWLSMLPNLKRFYFIDDGRNRYENINLDGDQPLPKLERLEKIRISSRPLKMFEKLIRENCHISELWLDNPKGYENVFWFSFPNLKKLTLVGCEQVQRLLNFPRSVQWPLESLAMKDVKFIYTFDHLLYVLERNFAGTLLTLKLHVSTPQIEDVYDFEDVNLELWEDLIESRLDLPKLKRIELDFGKEPVCLDFLLPMSDHLEEIYTSYTWMQPNDAEIRYVAMNVDCISSDERWIDSNVWQIFKKFKTLKVSLPKGVNWSDFVPRYRRNK